MAAAALAAVFVLGIAAPVVAQDISGEVLSKHNALRAKHGVPALSWSSKLANTAQDWANKCVFEHSNNGGENLAQGDGFPPAQFVQLQTDILVVDLVARSRRSALDLEQAFRQPVFHERRSVHPLSA